MKIGFLSLHSPFDRNSFSGTLHYMREALSATAGIEVAVLGQSAFRGQRLFKRCWSELGRLHDHFKQRGFKQNQARIGAAVKADLARYGHELDIIIAPVATQILAQLPASQLAPTIFITDAIPRFIESTYGRPLHPRRYADEEKVLRSCRRVIYSSHFMAEMARREYPWLSATETEKVAVVPFGLNLDRTPQPVVKTIDDPVHLLFVGKEWIRKGGAKALACLRALHQRGISAHLTIVGCAPPAGEILGPNVTLIPYLDKNSAREQWRYFELLQQAHFLLLPTTADCTPMVIAEANAFSTPVLAADVGGISTLLRTGENGVLLPAGAGGVDYAETVAQLRQAPDHYRQLSRGSRAAFDHRLNWRAWASEVIVHAQDVVSETGRSTEWRSALATLPHAAPPPPGRLA